MLIILIFSYENSSITTFYIYRFSLMTFLQSPWEPTVLMVSGQQVTLCLRELNTGVTEYYLPYVPCHALSAGDYTLLVYPLTTFGAYNLHWDHLVFKLDLLQKFGVCVSVRFVIHYLNRSDLFLVKSKFPSKGTSIYIHAFNYLFIFQTLKGL